MAQLGKCAVCGAKVLIADARPGDMIGCIDHAVVVDEYNDIETQIQKLRNQGIEVEADHPLSKRAETLRKQFPHWR